jgi:lipopolysaccharide export system permease protein
MYILTRYVVWEVFKLFLAALFGLTLVVMMAMGVKQALQMGLTAMVTLRTFPFMLPEILGITLPVSMLFSVSCVFGRMTGTNEIVALKSLGINPMAVIWPVLVFASFVSLGTVCMYDVAATWCKPSVVKVIFSSAEEIAYSKLRTDHSCSWPTMGSPQLSITVKRVDGRELISPRIEIAAQPGHPKTTIVAERAELHTDVEAQELILTCSDSEIKVAGEVTMNRPGDFQRSIPLIPPAIDHYSRDWAALNEISIRSRELDNQIQAMAASRDAKLAVGQPVDSEENTIARFQKTLFRLRAEPFRRWANGFCCLCFALIGAPVAMIWRHADVLTNFFACFLPILGVYYPLLMLSENLATNGKWPPIAFWLSNVLLAGCAVLLLRRIIRH